jgi:HEPN domain-containing protein
VGLFRRAAKRGEGLKALHLALGQGAWGHVVARLLSELPVAVEPELIERGRILDNFYLPTRDANGHPEGPPFEHYGPLHSEDAIRHARAILEFVRPQMA